MKSFEPKVTHTYTLTKKDVEELLLEHFGMENGNVNWKISEVGGDPMDRFPGYPDVIEVSVTAPK